VSDELLGVARSIVERGGNGEQIEAFLLHEREFSVKTFAGEIDSLSSAEPRGAGVRVIANGRAGFAYSTQLNDEGLDDLVDLARTNASSATPDEAVALPAEGGGSEQLDELIDRAQTEVTPDQKVEFALELERLTRAADARVRNVEEAVYSDSDTTIAIATSEGIEGTYRRTDAWCYSVAIATDGDDTEVGFEFDLARGMAGLSAEDVARKGAERACRVLGASKIPSARMPVVFDPYTAAQFLGVLGRALTGESVQKGRSMFAGKLGESVAADGLSLVDDGRAAGAPGASPWDAEGVATRRTEVITDGVLTTLLYDTISARREGRASSGNATRAGFKSSPGPSPSNLAFDPMGGSRDDILRQAGRALLVQDFHGVHSGANPVSGDFSVGVTGTLLENGDPVAPVKEVTVALPMVEILRSIVAVADDRRWLPFAGSVGGATTLVSEMTVGGA
jgi:PmbA protein